ncbi:protein Lines homolog 1 [Polypterus senegalus]|uniref:protein Lines homolog 1 n=1 Tax=Polypterus senegalus TaxID=55291 RepID=UPI001964AA86|nr:protein Lines homolog 1 [Polypterus senegalus]XP_039628648.1 protein Lines homolog 1 [Polypterus senegalus]XP_039628650.1 protein Lines homolog 1 [Polypterus senegalus]XP_039628651.1 protein Lines homolog 1 [Polypterus senegalus]
MNDRAVLEQIYKSLHSGTPIDMGSHDLASRICPGGVEQHLKTFENTNVCRSTESSDSCEPPLSRLQGGLDCSMTHQHQETRQNEKLWLQLSLIEMLSSTVGSNITEKTCREGGTEVLRILLTEMNLMAKLTSMFEDHEKLSSHLSMKCASSVVLYEIYTNNVFDDVWIQMCMETMKTGVCSKALYGCLWSLTAVIKGILKGRFGDKRSILKDLFITFDPVFNSLYYTILSRCHRDTSVNSVCLISFFSLLEAMAATALHFSLLETSPRLLFLQAPAVLQIIDSPVQYLVKKTMLLLVKKCLLRKAGEDFMNFEVKPLLGTTDDLNNNLYTMADAILQSLNSGWLQQVPICSHPCYFGGSDVLGKNAMEGKPDLIMLRTVSLIILKSMAYKTSKPSETVDTADSCQHLSHLLKFVKKHLPPQQLHHSCAWVSVVFMEQDDDMIEAANSLLAIYLHFRRVNDSHPNHDYGCNPHCLFVLFLRAVSFDHAVLLDFLISAETCFLEYFIMYLKLLQGECQEFYNTCSFCDNVPCEKYSNTLPLISCHDKKAASSPINLGFQLKRPQQHETAFPLNQSFSGAKSFEHLSPKKSSSHEYPSCENIKPLTGSLVDYESSDESDLDFECLASAERHNQGNDNKTTCQLVEESGQRECLPSSSSEVKMSHSCANQKNTFCKSVRCLVELREAILRLQRKNLFPYNPSALLKLLLQIETLTGLIQSKSES